MFKHKSDTQILARCFKIYRPKTFLRKYYLLCSGVFDFSVYTTTCILKDPCLEKKDSILSAFLLELTISIHNFMILYKKAIPKGCLRGFV